MLPRLGLNRDQLKAMYVVTSGGQYRSTFDTPVLDVNTYCFADRGCYSGIKFETTVATGVGSHEQHCLLTVIVGAVAKGPLQHDIHQCPSVV